MALNVEDLTSELNVDFSKLKTVRRVLPQRKSVSIDRPLKVDLSIDGLTRGLVSEVAEVNKRYVGASFRLLNKSAAVVAAVLPDQTSNLDKVQAQASSPCKVQATLEIAREAVSRIQQTERARLARAQAKNDVEDIEAGRIRFNSQAEQAAALQIAQHKLELAMAEIVALGKLRYVHTMKQIQDFAIEAMEEIASVYTGQRTPLKEAVANLESLLLGLPKAFDGVNGKGELARYEGGDPHKRLQQVIDHLTRRIDHMENAHEREVQKSVKISIVQDAFSKMQPQEIAKRFKVIAESAISKELDTAQREKLVRKSIELLFENSTVLFLESGRLMQNQGSDGNLYPQYFDVARFNRGQGRLDRLKGHNPQGYVMLAPKLLSDGSMEIRLVKGSNIILKEVFDTGGDLPCLPGMSEPLGNGTSLGKILQNFRGAAPKDTTQIVQHKASETPDCSGSLIQPERTVI